MSINWVMRRGRNGFFPLPGESIMYKSMPRTALALSTPAAFPGNDPVAMNCISGIAYLTNLRIVYLPDEATDEFASFSTQVLNLQDTHLTMPWFGPNSWQGLLKPVPGGNIPATQGYILLKLTFKEGGAPDFHASFERVRERLQEVVSTAQETSPAVRGQENNLANVDLSGVHLDELPSYQASALDRNIDDVDILDAPPFARIRTNRQNLRAAATPVAPTPMAAPVPMAAPIPIEAPVPIAAPTPMAAPMPIEAPVPIAAPIPIEAPPGYDESLEQSVQAELDRTLFQPPQ